MGNLARKLQQEQQNRTSQAPKKAKVKKIRVSPGEILLGVVFTAAVCFGAVQIVSNQAAIYEINKDVQMAEKNIQEQKKVNSDLEMQVKELSTYDRILKKAKELGLQLNEDNVKVVQD
ncbi:cell division protein FtsL [Bacillus methanolicus]|uniref:Cell division protein FtsL n=1 Tax=Bacillus methanolicus (strain MGA3 / ATCC 53907) TaxID=796606 RepID=I3DZ09_BACMM|nr:cell division protein FtsL [Bacillus methanolicus]AIE59554.1 cell division protein FtsL [Bacillus methanolicus MGA3]EIJ79480.1 cell division protein FtsL [Bacillus methanolicus MGA3]UQD51612.1 cell division protein FtsL [Bacillus methanolicus]